MDDSVVPLERIQSAIYLIRGKKVMLDADLADLYGVTTGNLNKAVSRNLARFPDDFMFRLTKEEFENLIFQNGRSSWGGTRKLPRAFTQEGIAMLSSVLRSERAAQVNIQIMRAFVRLRELALTHHGLAAKLEELDKRTQKHDKQIELVFKYIVFLAEPTEEEGLKEDRKRIGFGRE